MVGRTPEYLGKKIEQKEVKMAMLALIATSLCILVFSAHQLGGPFRSTRAATGIGVQPAPAIAQPEQRRAARIQRNSLRLFERDRQQRQRVRAASTRTRPGTT